MIKLYDDGVYILNGKDIVSIDKKHGHNEIHIPIDEARNNTITYSILKNHNTSEDMDNLKIRFDALASHDITYVGIIQTGRASGLTKFPIPYVLTNCHNSLCAVGGTINSDDHMFGLSAAKKYGGIFVPPHLAVIHQYMREMMAGCGKMILGSDSHTRYGALGTMAIGEGGGELAKQLLSKTYDIKAPQVIAVYLSGSPGKGIGPMDVALAIIGAVFKNGYVKNKVMEFIGDGIKNLNVDFRNGIDVMTTETTCLSSIWQTDEQVLNYYKTHGREFDYKELNPGGVAYYDGLVYVELDKIKPMIAMPFHPSNVYTIEELNNNLYDIINEVEKIGNEQLGTKKVRFNLKDKIKDGKLQITQGIIAGCAGGTYDNICDATDILNGSSIGTGEFNLSVYPSSQPIFMSLVENGNISKLMETGAIIRSAFCGPCFGAGEVPPNNGLSIRHTTRNFPSREGSKPDSGQIASVALMDARSIAATALNKGVLTAATDINCSYTKPAYYFKSEPYQNRVYYGWNSPQPDTELCFGPNIADWPDMISLTDHLLLKVASIIQDDVTTTDELIPSGETSSYRSNPLKLAEFTLSRKDPAYVSRAKEILEYEKMRREGKDISLINDEIKKAIMLVKRKFQDVSDSVSLGSVIYAKKPGDGSAREQAASCQKVLGGLANIAKEYATKRYRSNLINWGMLPFVLDESIPFELGDYIFVKDVKEAIESGKNTLDCYVVKDELVHFELKLADLTLDERKILLAGCLINYYAN